MKRALRLLASTTTWMCIGMICGFIVGRQAGYARAANDMFSLVMELRANPQPPEPFTKGAI